MCPISNKSQGVFEESLVVGVFYTLTEPHAADVVQGHNAATAVMAVSLHFQLFGWLTVRRTSVSLSSVMRMMVTVKWASNRSSTSLGHRAQCGSAPYFDSSLAFRTGYP